jgi:hypothetical protein
MAGTITATTIQNDTSSPPTFRNNSVEIGRLCRAWVNFNGTGTVAIRDSFNVSSITDNGTGDYTVNFTTAMPDVNYAPIGMSGNSTTVVINSISRTTSTCQINSVAFNIASPFQFDTTDIFVAFFR